jgi:hypothetical protein
VNTVRTETTQGLKSSRKGCLQDSDDLILKP